MATAVNPTIQYIFNPNASPPDDNTKVGGIINRGSATGFKGTEISLGQHTQFVPGPSGAINALHFDGVDSDPPTSTIGTGIDVGGTTGDPNINIASGPFTVMAWVNRDLLSGDNMVFGTGFGGPNDNPNTDGTGALHLGFRDTAIHYGFWNHDNSATGPLPSEWHHVAWRHDGVTTEDILLDGELISTDSGGLQYGNDFELLVGRQVFNQGAFVGSLSDVRIYNVMLTDAQVAAIAASPP
jgi:hypothetical protein